MDIKAYFVTLSNDSHPQTKATYHLHSVVCGKIQAVSLMKLILHFLRIYAVLYTFSTKKMKATAPQK